MDKFIAELIALYGAQESEIIMQIYKWKKTRPDLSDKSVMNKVLKLYPLDSIKSALMKLQINKLI